MANPLFNALGGSNMPNPFGNAQNLIKQFKQFRQTFKGNPRETVMQMVNSGKISQSQLNAAQQMAQQLKGVIGEMDDM